MACLSIVLLWYHELLGKLSTHFLSLTMASSEVTEFLLETTEHSGYRQRSGTGVKWFCFIVLFGFYGTSRLFHSFLNRVSRKVGRKRRDLRDTPLDHLPADLGLSHMWPDLGLNPQRLDDERLRVLNISVLNHSATGVVRGRLSNAYNHSKGKSRFKDTFILTLWMIGITNTK